MQGLKIAFIIKDYRDIKVIRHKVIYKSQDIVKALRNFQVQYGASEIIYKVYNTTYKWHYGVIEICKKQ